LRVAVGSSVIRVAIAGLVLALFSAALGVSLATSAPTAGMPPRQEPPPDRDADGLPDESDLCPIEPAGEYDVNKNGCPGPWKRIRPKIDFGRITMTRGLVVIDLMVIGALPAGTVVRIRAKGAYNPGGGPSTPPDPNGPAIGVVDGKLTAGKNGTVETKAIRRVSLKVGTKVRINATHPGWIGYYTELQIYSTRRPAPARTLCIPAVGPQLPVPCSVIDLGK
jgi:hypothetical protein